QQRLAIARGIQTSLALLKDAGVDPHEATAMMLMTQYLDMMTHVGANSRTNTILLPHSPGATGALLEQITSGLLAGRNPADAPAVAAANGAAVTVKPATTAPANA
ncbi:hypothetical protein HY480_02600, partial [Candidatus Uhrbacteria bacterium]|nr:hypothetical protein [Candidatus Uhrbacteria bacterium]